MNQQLIGSVGEALETFVQLKQQNTIILAWIQLKKCVKNYDYRSYPSRVINHPGNIAIKSGRSDYNSHIKGYHSSKSNSSASPRYQNYQRLVTDYAKIQPNQAMFQTFNQNGSTKWQNLHNNQAAQVRSHNRIGVTVQSNTELEDSDEFEDIVLDRLSKLQNSVNEMMRQKRIKEELRGYVGAPIQHGRRTQDFSEEQNLPNYVEPPSDRTLQNGQQVSQQNKDKSYQFWQNSPITKAKKSENLKNLKYIPIQNNKQVPVNIHKIKQMLKQKSFKASSSASHHLKDEQDLIDNVGYFNTVNLKGANRERSESSYEAGHHFDKLKNHFKYANKNEPVTQQKPSAILHSKYGYSNTTKNQVTPLQFFSKNLQMQSVIQPGAKFVRSPRSNRHNINFSGGSSQVKRTQPKNLFKARNSGDSNYSGQSYFSNPVWNPNVTSLY